MEMDRRSFLKGALAAGTLAAGGVLAAPAVAGPVGAPAGGGKTAASLDEKWVFEIPPDPIPDANISETITRDIVIIGSGLAGVTCGASAVSHGVKDLVLFSAGTKPLARGGSFHAINSKYQKSVGIDYTIENNARHVRMEQYIAGYKVNKQLWARWINNSEEYANWMIDTMAAKGLQPALELEFRDVDGLLSNPPAALNFWREGIDNARLDGAPLVAEAYADTITDAGCDIHYSTKAIHLIREGTGPVTGVVAQKEDGSYVKYEARKAVVMATGDFSKDPDMVAKYNPWAYKTFEDILFADLNVNYDVEFEYNGLMDGHGQKMGLWVGAAWQKVYPNAVMSSRGAAGPANNNGYNNFWGINLNIHGERYHGENTAAALGSQSNLNQPKSTVFSIWDVNYVNTRDKWPDAATTVDEVVGPLWASKEETLELWDRNADRGSYYRADTIEGLIDLLVAAEGINKENALASIEKYNRWAAQGNDEEYHVDPSVLKPIDTPPFYAAITKGMSFLTILGGLRTNAKMQVCDEDDEPIPGLYNVGSMVGDMYGTLYSFGMSGQNLGSTAGALSYMLGKDLAKL